MSLERTIQKWRKHLGAAGILAAVVTAGSLMAPAHALADCKEDVAKAFEKQRETAEYRMKTRQISARGILFLTIDYMLPFKMHQTATSPTSSDKTELILIGPRAWQSRGLGWVTMGDDETKALNKQFGAAVLNPPEDKLVYECLGQVDVDGRALAAYQGKQGETVNARTDTEMLRTVYIDPDTGLPARTSVARGDKPDVAFFKADYTYPKDLSIEPPENAKPAQKRGTNEKSVPNQSTKP